VTAGTLPSNSYHYQYHRGWHYGHCADWRHCPPAWLGSVAAAGWLLGPRPTYVYSNPFYVVSSTAVAPALDYSQPIAVPEPSAPPSARAETAAAPPSESPSDEEAAPGAQEISVPPEAIEHFDAARNAFKKGDYRKALDQVDKAITILPSDAALHEFRALVLFAQGKYKDAAAAIYAVLAAGPGWNWETLRAFYADTQTYTKQLRALEDYEKAHRQSSAADFLLAYHYLTLGYTSNAVSQLRQFAKLVPEDKLAPQLIEAFAPPDTDKPAARLE
jgi:tetratricopeptide (TPR) repeat protein